LRIRYKSVEFNFEKKKKGELNDENEVICKARETLHRDFHSKAVHYLERDEVNGLKLLGRQQLGRENLSVTHDRKGWRGCWA
jgi:hypothetical protein